MVSALSLNSMEQGQTVEFTKLIKAWAGGDRTALDRLTPFIYTELRRLARHYMHGENPTSSLQTTALVHEAWLRLADVEDAVCEDRGHFFTMCASIMRHILVDAARRRCAARRGGADHRRSAIAGPDLDNIPVNGSDHSRDFVALNDALTELAQIDPRKAKVIELRFFGGLSVEETAEILEISPQSVMRDWRLARSWLMRELRR
jgi:RNA polymerase sigma factor (TIGR02999 family)